MINTNRNSTHSTSFNFRKNITSDVNEEKMGEMVKEFKPKSDILNEVDMTNFRIKKYKNGAYFGQLVKDETEEGGEIKEGFGCIFYYNGRQYEG